VGPLAERLEALERVVHKDQVAVLFRVVFVGRAGQLLLLGGSWWEE